MHYKGKYLKRTSYKFPKKHFSSFDSLIFRGKMYNIPNNVEELLMVIYGDWKIPKKTSVKEDYLEKQIVIKKTVLNRIIKRVAKLTKKYWT